MGQARPSRRAAPAVLPLVSIKGPLPIYIFGTFCHLRHLQAATALTN